MAEEEITTAPMRNQKASDAKTKKSDKVNPSQTENLSATAEAEVTMVLMQNQNRANFANRIESKVEVRTKKPSTTAGKEMTILSDLNPKISRCERLKDRKTKTYFLPQRRKTKTKIHPQRQKIKTKYLPIQACFKRN